MTRLATLMLALILGCSRHAFALEPHVHGTGRLQLVIEDGTLYADLRIPADDVVGYEHGPTTVAERATLTHALALLQDPTKGLTVPNAAHCTAQPGEVTSAMKDPVRATDETQRDHGIAEGNMDEDSDEGHGETHSHEHTEFHAIYRYSCGNSEALDHLEIPLLSALPQLQHLDVQSVSPGGQREQRLGPPQHTVELK